MGMAPVHTAEWSERLERLMDRYRALSNRRRLEAAMKRWRKQQARIVLAALERAPDRIH